MEKLLDCKLADGFISECYFASDIKDLSKHLSSYGTNVLWVFDSNSAHLFKQLPANRVVLEPGERYKTFEAVEKILSTALSLGLSRDSRFIGFGGGVVCDMTALASSLYMRGCNLTLVPTTLLCMVDASLGGKTGVDYGGAKNTIGSFYPASEVLISSDTLRTLPANEYLSGLGEVVKHAFLAKDDELFKFLEANSKAILNRDKVVVSKMVKLSLDVKKSYLERDPKEKLGIRSFLNFGHTFAHALEALGHFSYSHGVAVAWGCARAFEVGVKLNLTDKEYANRAYALLSLFGFNLGYRIERGNWLEFASAIGKDKKKLTGKVNFVICKKQGEFELTPLDTKTIQDAVLSTPWT